MTKSISMRELEVYDQTIGTKYKKIAESILPLVSWEFYAEHHSSLLSFKDDLDALKRLSIKWNFDHNYTKEFIEKQSVILVTNPDLKIVYASHNIENMNGYMPEEIIGRSPKMFQGEETCLKTAQQIREAVEKRLPFEVSILNYRKDKKTYMCKIKGFPVFNKKGSLVNYIAFEKAA